MDFQTETALLTLAIPLNFATNNILLKVYGDDAEMRV